MAPANSEDAKLPEGTLKAQLVKDFGGVEGELFVRSVCTTPSHDPFTVSIL
jgi:hypothetical protein